MAGKFPILAITKAALSAPLSSPIDILKALGLFIVATIVGVIIMGIFMILGGIDPNNLVNLQQSMQSGDFGSLDGLGMIFLGYLLLFIIVILAVAHIFNHWVRVGAFGSEQAKIRPFGRAMKLAAINMLKFIFIGILIVIAALVLQFVLSQIGLAPSFGDQLATAASGDTAGQYTSSVLLTVINTVLYCLIYSFFSANLTQTALDTDAEGFEHPHTLDFAIVLVLIYAVLLIPTFILAFMGLGGAVLVIQFILSVYISFAIGAAHGLRYRFCVPTEREVFE